MPDTFAPNFPLPWGMTVLKATAMAGDPQRPQWKIVALAPMNLGDSESYLTLQLPRTGYHIKFRESEGGEVEGQFQGQGWVGSYIVNAVLDCPEVTTWTIIVVKR